MPFTSNAVDGTRIYFEDDGGEGPPVIFLSGLGDPIPASRRWGVSGAIAPDHRTIYIDHRGHGGSDKPHDPAAYATRSRVADLVAVLDELRLERSHFIGASWGARLLFGLGEHAPDRVLSLTMGGQSPYAMDSSSAGVRMVTQAFIHGSSMEDFWVALGGFGDLDGDTQSEVLANDFKALSAAWRAAMEEGAVAKDLARWQIPCLIYVGTEDTDFYKDARRAAFTIPRAAFVGLEGLTHIGAHGNVDDILPHILQLI